MPQLLIYMHDSHKLPLPCWINSQTNFSLILIELFVISNPLQMATKDWDLFLLEFEYFLDDLLQTLLLWEKAFPALF